MRLLLYSFALFSALPFTAWYLYQWRVEVWQADPTYYIRRIVQPKKAVPEQLIADWLGLRQETSLYGFCEKKAEKRLEQHMLIEKARVEKRLPDALFIELKLRQPIARIADLAGAGVDSQGLLFPIDLFTSPKRLTLFYLGLDPAKVNWGTRLVGERYNKACEVLAFFSKRSSSLGLFVERIDTSRAFEESIGRCEIVVHLSEQSHHEGSEGRILLIHRWIARLPTEGYEKRWGDLRALCNQLKLEHAATASGSLKETFDARVLDLRIEGLGFVK